MRAKELIRELEQSVELYGNLRVKVRDGEHGISYDGISVLLDPASPAEEERGEEGWINLSVYGI